MTNNPVAAGRIEIAEHMFLLSEHFYRGGCMLQNSTENWGAILFFARGIETSQTAQLVRHNGASIHQGILAEMRPATEMTAMKQLLNIMGKSNMFTRGIVGAVVPSKQFSAADTEKARSFTDDMLTRTNPGRSNTIARYYQFARAFEETPSYAPEPYVPSYARGM